MCKWSKSLIEEVISVLWLIAALQAWDCEFYTFAKILFVKASYDTWCSLRAAVIEWKGQDNAN